MVSSDKNWLTGGGATREWRVRGQMWVMVKGDGHGCSELVLMGLTQLTPDKLLHAVAPTDQLGIQFGAATACAVASRRRPTPAATARMQCGAVRGAVDRWPSTSWHAHTPAQPNARRGGRGTTPSVPGLDNWSGQWPTLPLVQRSNHTPVPGPG